MSHVRILLATALTLALAAPLYGAGEAAKAEMDVLRESIRADKKAVVAAGLTLTDEEAARFWPLYDRYQKELTAIHDRLVKVIEEYGASFPDVSNEKAMKLTEDYLAAESDRAQLRRKYLAELAKALPGRKVMLFYQIENKIDAIVRYDLAAGIPVVGK
jgi:hypothetical protein